MELLQRECASHEKMVKLVAFSLQASLVHACEQAEDNRRINQRGRLPLSVLPILIGLLAAADPAPATQAPAPAANQSAPTTPAPSIDSILKDQRQSGEDDEQSAAPNALVPAPAPIAPAVPGGPAPYSDLDSKAYGEAILAAARAAQALQGPLDGGWSLTDSRGRRMYSFRMVDQGQGMGLAQGAWRDLQAGEGPATSGFVASVGYDGDKLMLRFYEAGPDDLIVLTVKPSSGKDWPGEFWHNGAVAKVTFSRE